MDDSAGCIGTAYRRACQLFARAAAGVASPDAPAERIALLVEKDDYGVRHSLLEHVAQFLDSGVSPTKVRKVPQDFCQQSGRKGFSARGPLFSSNVV